MINQYDTPPAQLKNKKQVLCIICSRPFWKFAYSGASRRGKLPLRSAHSLTCSPRCSKRYIAVRQYKNFNPLRPKDLNTSTSYT